MVRLDSAHDAIATLVALKEENVDCIVKWNPRGADVPARASEIFAHGKMIKQDKTCRIAFMTETIERTYQDEDGEEQTLKLRRVLRATERYFEKDGTPMLVPDIEVEGWWTGLSVAKDKVIELYKGHTLCEQYHSELKSDMDLERLPSGKFATNTLIMHCAGLAYNILCTVGQIGLMTGKQRRRAKQRRRLKTVIQDLVCFAGRSIRHAHTRRCVSVGMLMISMTRSAGPTDGSLMVDRNRDQNNHGTEKPHHQSEGAPARPQTGTERRHLVKIS